VNLADAARAALVPWVGVIVADACLRAAANSLGVPVECLGTQHLDALESTIRGMLAPVAPPQAIDDVISQLRETNGGDL
jgi:hypothetical protein